MQNVFDSLGLPSLSKDQIVQQRTQDMSREFRNLVAEQARYVNPNDRGVFQAFANLGREIGGKPVGQLTAQEKQQFAMMEKANASMRELQNSPDWADLDGEEKAFRSQEAIAKAAMDSGDLSTAMQLSQDVVAKRRRAAKAKKEAEVLDLNLESAQDDLTEKQETRGFRDAQRRNQTIGDRLANEAAQRKLDTVQSDAVVTAMVPQDGTQFNFGADPKVVTGVVKNGILHGTDGGVYSAHMGADIWDDAADKYIKRQKASGNTGVSGRRTSYVKDIGQKNIEKARSEFVSTKKFVGVGRDIQQGIKAFENLGSDPTSAVGAAGTVSRIIDKAVRTVGGVTAAFTIGGEKQADGTIVGGRKVSGMEASLKEYGGMIALPDGIEEASAAATRYRSGVMQAVYLDARVFEPDARALSDGDIERAMDRLGVDSGNPQTILSVLGNRMRQSAEGVLSQADMYLSLAKAHGLSEAEAGTLIYGPDGLEAMAELVEEGHTMQADNDQFGHAANIREQNGEAPAEPTEEVDLRSVIDGLEDL